MKAKRPSIEIIVKVRSPTPSALDGVTGTFQRDEDLRSTARAAEYLTARPPSRELQDRFDILIETGCAKLRKRFLAASQFFLDIHKGSRSLWCQTVAGFLCSKLLDLYLVVFEINYAALQRRLPFNSMRGLPSMVVGWGIRTLARRALLAP